jgi:FdhD protein
MGLNMEDRIMANIEYTRLNGDTTGARESVVRETAISIVINNKHYTTAMITATMEREFVTGYLFGQGLIDNIEELESVNMEGNVARVTVKDARKISQRIKKTDYRIVSGGGLAAFLDGTSFPRIHTRMKIGKNEIFRAMNTVFEKAEIYKATEGTHAAGLFTPEATPICIAEDIGRHNAMDKVIGYALINRVDCGNTFLVSTGRMASEMVAKTCRANIPVVATKTAVTQSGLEIGKKCGLTIIGFVRDKGTRLNTDMEVRVITEPGMKIYTHAERIICE